MYVISMTKYLIRIDIPVSRHTGIILKKKIFTRAIVK